VADHILDDVRLSAPHHGGEISASFDSETQVLDVTFFRHEVGNYSFAHETKHFRLVEVQQVWQEVDRG
jgi:hypothetical protein